MTSAHRAACLCAAGGVLVVSNAFAFCRTRTCDPGRESCDVVDQCIQTGLELEWPSSCIGFTVQEDGSKRNDISADTLEQVVEQAFARWRAVDCGEGTHPDLSVESLGRVACDRVEYNKDYGNANIFMFRDDEWKATGTGHALALTTVWFNPDTGSVYDADVEINGSTTGITIGQPKDGIDLPSIVTHEIGHFLGLSHSSNPKAVMRPYYEPKQDDLRVPQADDIAGICSIYPPGRPVKTDDCSPRHGLADDCRNAVDDGCSVVAPGMRSSRSDAGSDAGPTLLASLGLGLVGWRRRARVRSRSL